MRLGLLYAPDMVLEGKNEKIAARVADMVNETTAGVNHLAQIAFATVQTILFFDLCPSFFSLPPFSPFLQSFPTFHFRNEVAFAFFYLK